MIGIPAVIGATVASHLLRSKQNSIWRLKGVAALAAFFVVESLRAGVDVAWRAVSLDIAPHIIEYESGLEDETGLTLFCGTISLLPGTLTTEVQERTLRIHTLDSRQSVREQLRRLECRIAAMFATPRQRVD
jgi:multisubunit Na+/H+ antiporter MnhE subunit